MPVILTVFEGTQMTTRLQGVAESECEENPRGLPLSLLSCTIFLKEGLEELHCQSARLLGPVSGCYRYDYPQSVLVDSMSKEGRLNIRNDIICFSRNNRDKLKDYRTFWYEDLKSIDDLLARFPAAFRIRTLRLTAPVSYAYESILSGEEPPHQHFQSTFSQGLQLDVFEFEMGLLYEHISFWDSDLHNC